MSPATDAPRISAVVVSYDSDDDLRALLPTLDDDRIEVVIVDNGPTPTATKPSERVQVIRPDANIGWSRGCNLGASRAAAPVLAFVNPDARPTADDLLALAEALDDPTIGAVAPRFVDADGRAQAFYFRFPTPLHGVFCFLTAGQAVDRLLGEPFIRHRTYDYGRQLPRPVDQPGAACLVARARDLDRLGGFDPSMFLFFADTDLCRRLARQGMPAHVLWDRDVVHVGGATVRRLDREAVRALVQRDYLAYLRRHHGAVASRLTEIAVILLTGLLPAVWHLLRLRPAAAWQQVRIAQRVLHATVPVP
jgi:N-acetylglucosaminyl-diphospho-decaprenol L-rhamnosyltransferase